MDLEILRTFCLSMHGATEGIKWEDHICFMVGGKMFCVTGADGGTSLKLTPGEFDTLTEKDGIIPAPYMARNKWVTIHSFKTLKNSEWQQLIEMSYSLVSTSLSKKVQKELGIA